MKTRKAIIAAFGATALAATAGGMAVAQLSPTAGGGGGGGGGGTGGNGAPSTNIGVQTCGDVTVAATAINTRSRSRCSGQKQNNSIRNASNGGKGGNGGHGGKGGSAFNRF
jgi:hypothetical protein